MSFSGTQRVPRTPTLPKGETVALYESYLEAQRAVDHLSDKEFPVQHVTIVGNDLKMVERVIGRLTYPRVALSGFASGAWFGLFVGWLLGIFSGQLLSTILAGVLIGGAFGLLFGVIAYAFTGGKRDFTSSSQIVASSYAVLCQPEKAHQARSLLAEVGGVQSGWPARPAPAAGPQVPSPSAPVGPQGQGGPGPFAPPAPQPSPQPWGSPTPPPPAPGAGDGRVAGEEGRTGSSAL
ncbi:general stress protein [Cellulomonas endophytica]|uniref:general stress protein n=1 Tax=Cellulomonas endophytica TaxID=2494735 RepID=UPI0010110EBC|nr:general stress protein [Cellulomonas endophytica]